MRLGALADLVRYGISFDHHPCTKEMKSAPGAAVRLCLAGFGYILPVVVVLQDLQDAAVCARNM
jgi:hypothetical protein